jgi:hypothetical protein
MLDDNWFEIENKKVQLGIEKWINHREELRKEELFPARLIIRSLNNSNKKDLG